MLCKFVLVLIQGTSRCFWCWIWVVFVVVLVVDLVCSTRLWLVLVVFQGCSGGGSRPCKKKQMQTIFFFQL